MSVNEGRVVVEKRTIVAEVPLEGEGTALIAAEQITVRETIDNIYGETTDVSCCFVNLTP